MSRVHDALRKAAKEPSADIAPPPRPPRAPAPSEPLPNYEKQPAGSRRRRTTGSFKGYWCGRCGSSDQGGSPN